MAESRAEKVAVRNLWIESLSEADLMTRPEDSPLYLTLPGREGADVRLLADRGLVQLNEVGGVAIDDAGKVVAVERNSEAVLELQSRFPGLKIFDQPIENLLHSINPVAWPTGRDRVWCRAKVVNLDLDGAS